MKAEEIIVSLVEWKSMQIASANETKSYISHHKQQNIRYKNFVI